MFFVLGLIETMEAFPPQQEIAPQQEQSFDIGLGL
jgi:hypothetical protein